MSVLRCPWWHAADEFAAGLRLGLGLPSGGTVGCQRAALVCRARRGIRNVADVAFGVRLAVGVWRSMWRRS